MKTILKPFHDTETGFITTLLEKTSYDIPSLYVDESKNKDVYDVNPLSMYNSTKPVPLLLMYDKPPINIDINFDEYGVVPTNYQLKILKGHTPPTQWEIYGKNEENENWILIDNPPETTDLCPFGVVGNVDYDYQCDETTTSTFKINRPIGPFKHIRFSLLKERSNGSQRIMLRIYKFEIYGMLCSFNKSLCISTCKYKEYSLFIKLTYLIVILILK